MYDLIIVGAGPAGITAAVYAARQKLDLLVIARDVGGQAIWSGDIDNYTGYQFISGVELIGKFEDHLNKFKVPLHTGEEVKEVIQNEGIFNIKTDKDTYQSRTVIVASGKVPRLLGVKGEKELRSKGVMYCATCDAPLFADLDVAVIGAGNSALDAVIQLIKIAKKIYLINHGPKLKGDAVMIEKAEASDKVTIFNNTKTLEIIGDKMVEGLVVESEGKALKLDLQGIFIEIGSVPSSGFAGLAAMNNSKEIKIGRENETNIPGLFAAGDVSDIMDKQIIIAAGEGAKAAISAFKYLNTLKQGDAKAIKCNVFFTISKVKIDAVSDKTILEIAEANGVQIDYQCRQGVCGSCKVKLFKGEVNMSGASALSDDEIKTGYILACVSRPKTPSVEIEA
jgi:alkyl hydroperoxide reductase subunit F